MPSSRGSSKRKAEAPLVEQEAAEEEEEEFASSSNSNHHGRQGDDDQQVQEQAAYTTRQDLKCLDILEHPVWVFDIENKSMWWANTSAALSLWNSPTRQALLERNFAHDMSEATHKRLQDYLRRFREGEKVHESWTFYPNGEGPVTVHVTCSGLLIRDVVDDDDDSSTSNATAATAAAASPAAAQSTAAARKNNHHTTLRLAMLVEGDTPKADAEIDKSALRGVEMLRHLPVPISQFDCNGMEMYSNPEAAHVFGAAAAAAGNDDKNKSDKDNASDYSNEIKDNNQSSSAASCDFLQRFENKELGRRILKIVLQDGLDFQDEVLQYARTASVTAISPSSVDDTASSAASTEKTAVSADVVPRWFSVKCRRSKDPVTAEPVLLYSARDLTDLKKMDALVLAKDEFVATMAHEIRTPLHQVQGFLELLSSTKHQMTAFQQENVVYMENSALSLSTVVNDILDYSKLEIGHMKLECIPFEMKTAVVTSIAAIRSKALAKSIQIRHYFNNNMDDDDNHTSSNKSDNDDDSDDDIANVPRLVAGDPSRMRQILLNLLQNSVKFTREHGHISLSVTRIRNDHYTSNSDSTGLEPDEIGGIPIGNQQDDESFAPRHNPNNMSSTNDSFSNGTFPLSTAAAAAATTTARQREVRLRFEVVDDGIGIHPDRLEDIFNKYQQADTSIARQYGGTGLGLSICKRLVAAMNGSIGVTSPGLGHGSTFWMEIPFQAVTESASSPLPSSAQVTCTAMMTKTTTTPPPILPARIDASSLSSSQGESMEAISSNQGNHDNRDADSMSCCHTNEGGCLHVLVAEDNTANQKLSKAMLRRLGHTCVIAENGAKAIEAVENAASVSAGTSVVRGARGEDETEDLRPFHVVLMDVQMPVMDGLEATRELRRRGFTHNKLAIIGLTAGYQPSERQKYLDVGMNDCFGKPTRMNELRSVLAKAVLQQDDSSDNEGDVTQF